MRLWLHTILDSRTIYGIKKLKVQLPSIMASSECKKDLFKQQRLKDPRLVQLDKVLSKWFTAMHSKGKPVTGCMITAKAVFCGEMKIRSVHSLKTVTKITCKNLDQCRYYLII
jgi:hypothetical protein